MALRIVSILILCGLAVSVWHAFNVARADLYYRDNNLASTRAAVRIAPGNAVYHELLAELEEAEGANPDAELTKTTDLSPRESIYWIRRAFRAEVERKYDESERYLDEANRVDHGFDPRWALMNYYFRRGMAPQFWKATRAALEMSYGDRSPLFKLCLAMNNDPAVTRQVIPEKREILYQFFIYLIQQNRVQAASAIAEELAPKAQAEELPWLVKFCDRQAGRDDGSSLIVWNALCRRRLVNFSELAPDRGKIITNGDFSAPPLQQGFDWKYGNSAGFSVNLIDATQGISVNVSGDEPDQAYILEETVPLTPGKQYLLNYTYRLMDTQPDSGLQWVLLADVPHKPGTEESIGNSSVFSGTDWHNAQMSFPAGSHSSARLILQYRRAPATLRWKGTVQIRKIASGLATTGLSGSGPGK